MILKGIPDKEIRATKLYVNIGTGGLCRDAAVQRCYQETV